MYRRLREKVYTKHIYVVYLPVTARQRTAWRAVCTKEKIAMSKKSKVKDLKREIKARKSKIAKHEGKLKRARKALKKAA